MDYDVGNQQMLQAGALYSQGGGVVQSGQGWQPLSTAPRDGTVIEIRCTYGVAPWFGIYRYTDTRRMRDQSGALTEFKTTPGWVKVGDDASGFSEDSTFTWRPYKGDTATYVDPTGGAQNSPAYWRGAVAAKYNLPLDAFESETAKNGGQKYAPKKIGFWNWLFGE